MSTTHKTCFRCGISSGTKSVPSSWRRMVSNNRVILCSACGHSPDFSVGWKEWEARVLAEGRDFKAAELKAKAEAVKAFLAVEQEQRKQNANAQWRHMLDNFQGTVTVNGVVVK